MEEEQLYYYTEASLTLHVFHRLAPLIMDGLFMDRPIHVSVISDAVTHNAETFMLVQQDCHFYGNTLR